MKIKTKNKMTDHQDAQVKDSPEESEPEHDVNIEPQFFCDLSAPEVVKH